MIGTLSAPCEHCPERHTLCHSTCGKYLAYRAKMDDISFKLCNISFRFFFVAGRKLYFGFHIISSCGPAGRDSSHPAGFCLP